MRQIYTISTTIKHHFMKPGFLPERIEVNSNPSTLLAILKQCRKDYLILLCDEFPIHTHRIQDI